LTEDTAKQIKVENFKITKDTSIEVNSGLIILIFGIIAMVLPLTTILSYISGDSVNYHPYLLGNLTDIITFVLATIGLNSLIFIISAVVGWGIGGIFSALIYGQEGKNGPLYASYIVFRLILGLALLLVPYGILSGFGGSMYLSAIIVLVIFLVSLPMILIASITYRIGLWISPQ